MSAAEVTEYIQAQDEPKRSTLEAMREIILEIEPGLEQAIMWKSAQFKFKDKIVVGLCAHKNHLSFSTPSADVLSGLATDLQDFVTSKNSFQFGSGQVLPKDLVKKIVKARLSELA
ncbi:MAG: hypothetical protein RLZZ06_566 [Actinomycetota bacterium]|jgi:uncharacterized protein YdhG (YjbR/CyaY superfamily)